MWLQLMKNTDGVMGHVIRSCDFMLTFQTFILYQNPKWQTLAMS